MTPKTRAQKTVAKAIEKADAALAKVAGQAPKGKRVKVVKAPAYSPSFVLGKPDLTSKDQVRQVIASASVSTMPASEWINGCSNTESVNGKVAYGLAVIFSHFEDTPDGKIYPSVTLLASSIKVSADTPRALLQEILGKETISGHLTRAMRTLMGGARKWASAAKVEMPAAARAEQVKKTPTIRIDGPSPRFEVVDGRSQPVQDESGGVTYTAASCDFATALNLELTREWACNIFRGSLSGVNLDGLRAVGDTIGKAIHEFKAKVA